MNTSTKRVLLAALLLAPPAAGAQVTVPALPPGSAGPATTAAPAQNTPAQTAPTSSTPSAGAVTLTLSAPVGTAVELATVTQTRLTLEDVGATGAGGQATTGAELDALRRQISEGLNAAGAQSVPGKAFFRVQGRAVDGTVTLLSTVVTNAPGAGAFSFRIVQTVAPNGRTEITRVESDNPDVQAVLSRLSPELLRAQAGAGGDLAGLYGRSFTVGQPVTQTASVDLQGLLGGVFSALGGGQNPFGTVRAQPLTVTTVTTYQGVNAAGQRVFNTRSTLGASTFEAAGGADVPAFRLEFLGGTGGGQVLYRPDGLPAAQSQTQTLRMRLALNSPGGERVTLVLRLDQTVALRPR